MAQFRFTHISGALQGHMDTVETTPILIGRDDACHVKLDREKDLVVSGQHAKIDMPRDGEYSLENLSKNGTFMNGQFVEQPIRLPNHSVIQLGRDGPRLRFDVDENVAGFSFAAARSNTAKLQRGEVERAKAPTTEERPAFKVDADDKKKSSGGGGGGLPVSPAVLIAGVAVLIVVAAIIVVFALR